jgi:hypothetical protein
MVLLPAGNISHLLPFQTTKNHCRLVGDSTNKGSLIKGIVFIKSINYLLQFRHPMSPGGMRGGGAGPSRGGGWANDVGPWGEAGNWGARGGGWWQDKRDGGYGGARGGDAGYGGARGGDYGGARGGEGGYGASRGGAGSRD